MAEQGPLSGQTVGDKYVLGELLGEGGFGAVYKAHHHHLQRQQAIKILLERYFQKKEFRERFLREAQTVATLDHPNIIHTDDFWVEPSRAYLVMPFIKGGTFRDVLRKQKNFLGLEQIVFYLEHICAALDYAHANGVVHLDLKPLNLLVHDDGRLLLADFGLAHLMKQGVVAGGSSLLFGTPHYMAPEHIQGHPEQRSDLFSLGVIFYQMLVGRLPFEGLAPEAVMIKNMMEWPPAPRTIRQDLPQSVEDVAAKALAKQPEQRYQTASDLLAAFKKALNVQHIRESAVSDISDRSTKTKTQPEEIEDLGGQGATSPEIVKADIQGSPLAPDQPRGNEISHHMRWGDGSLLLGQGDPRSAEIGILYVEPEAGRQEILTAISTMDRQGKKQIAIVLPEQGKAFRQKVDFDRLKNMRRQLKAQLIFIAPPGPGPAEFARQRRFLVYSSLETFRAETLVETLLERYEAVRSKRVTDPAQIFDLARRFEDLGNDPFAGPRIDFDALLAAQKLREQVRLQNLLDPPPV
ncbi:MAG TPA: serine/threonine-protein kinase [Ktedonobacteraceae bacterium]|nr:serine/threonine-protein kinase [Ktedonobacteraceae bacterium]